MLAAESYRSSDPADPVVSECQHIWGQYVVGAVMGVPITALDRVVGEISLMRDGHLASPFTEEDETVAVEAALALGVRLPALLAGYVGAYGPDPEVQPGRLPASGITQVTARPPAPQPAAKTHDASASNYARHTVVM